MAIIKKGGYVQPDEPLNPVPPSQRKPAGYCSRCGRLIIGDSGPARCPDCTEPVYREEPGDNPFVYKAAALVGGALLAIMIAGVICLFVMS